MRNRVVGILVIGIAILIGFIIYSFNTSMANIVNESCSMGPTCPMWGTINFQTDVSLAIMIFIIALGLYLIFFGQEEKIITKFKTLRTQVESKKITKQNYQKILSGLGRDERTVLEKVIKSQGTIFQSDLVDETKFAKVKVTRILDKLEGRDLIERKRRGMTNVVILKH
jgi:NADH:ubiquinone oxidoreductase subunit 5 (subunit L)/multisubunit Na+/H+ antiporter MnhA subunit